MIGKIKKGSGFKGCVKNDTNGDADDEDEDSTEIAPA